MSKKLNANSLMYKVKVQLCLVDGMYPFRAVKFRFKNKEDADAKEAEIEATLDSAIRGESEIFTVGSIVMKSSMLNGFKITIKDPPPVTEGEDSDDEDDD